MQTRKKAAKVFVVEGAVDKRCWNLARVGHDVIIGRISHDVDDAFATFDNAFSVSPRNHGYKEGNNFNVLFLAKSMGELNGIFFQKMSLLVEGRFEIEEFF